MKKLLSCALLAAAACAPTVEQTPPTKYVVAQFDPARSPPLVPSPNDLAMDPQTGRVAVPLAPGASAIDTEFARHLATLDGFPADTAATATFSARLDPASVTPDTIQIYDNVTAKKVDTRPLYQDTLDPAAPGRLVVPPPTGGWKPGGSYTIVVLGGMVGPRGLDGEAVTASTTFALARAKHSLVTCVDLADPGCRATTDLLPSHQSDPEQKLAEQTALALQLEPLRRGLKPMFDAFEKNGLPRAMVALAWTFRIASFPAMTFDPAATPPAVPVPNDLAIDPETGLVDAPIDPAASPAEQEFTRDFLNTLDGFPQQATARASVAAPGLHPNSVTSASVRVFDLTAQAPVTAVPEYDEKARTVSIAAPAAGWTKGHQYAIAILGGAQGVKSASGGPAVASQIWALARAKAPLVTCEGAALDVASCSPALSLAPMTVDQAVQLETLRRGLSPLLSAFEAMGLPREQLVLAWSFRVVSRSELTFDPEASVIPFPNDLVRVPAAGSTPAHVALPIPADASAAQQALYRGLNTLDGFSTTAPVLSENALDRAALDQGSIEAASLTPEALGLVNLAPSGAAPDFRACLNCVGSAKAPEALQLVPNVPLEETTPYAGFVTTRVKGAGKPVIPAVTFALVRLSKPLVDANGKSQLSLLTDAQAAQLEPLRQGFAPVVAALEAKGIARRDLALAWAFTTQTTASALTAIHDLPQAFAGQLPDVPGYAVDQTATFFAAMDAAGIPHDKVGKVFAGRFPTMNLLTGPGGTLDPKAPAPEFVSFVLGLPAAAAPAQGYPVVVFNHGVTSQRTVVLPLVNALAAAGYAVVSADVAWHGERTTCVGSRVATGAASDDAACADPLTQTCDATSGRCVARSGRLACDPATTGTLPADVYCAQKGQGECVRTGAPTAWKCAGGSVNPALSGWNFIDPSNLFATRDNFRQQVADLAQLRRVLVATTKSPVAPCLNDLLAAQGAGRLDGSTLHFVGHSLGGMLGTLYAAASPDVQRVVLNVPGGGLTDVLLTSPGLAPIREAMNAGLAAQGITEGTAAYDQFTSIARWVLDPADAVNAAHRVANGVRQPATRRALVQYVTGDQVIPNATTLALLASANRPGVLRPLWSVEFDGSALAPDKRHSFLLNGGELTPQVQLQLVQFLSTGEKPSGAKP